MFDDWCKRTNRRSPITVCVLNIKDQVIVTLLRMYTYIHFKLSSKNVSIRGWQLHSTRLPSSPTASLRLAAVPELTVYLPRPQTLHMATCNSGPAAHKPRLRVCVSDTHNAQPKLPNGEILIHAGDLTQSGSLQEIQKTVDWLRSQPHAIKIVSHCWEP